MISDLTIISVSYNSAGVFLENWKNFLKDSSVETIIVDNASSDLSGDILTKTFPNIKVVQLEQNVGYGRAANAGLSLCESRFALLLNPDLIVSKEAVAQLLALAVEDEDDSAIWAPAITGEDRSTGMPVVVEAVSGAAMLFDLEKMNEVGFFDENIFLYSEESDLCHRVRLAGYSIKRCASVYLQHFGDGSSGQNQGLSYMKSWHFGWSRCYFYRKHGFDIGKRSPLKMHRNYKLKSYFSLNKISRFDYKAKAAGVKAFIEGEGAFRRDGAPQMFHV